MKRWMAVATASLLLAGCGETARPAAPSMVAPPPVKSTLLDRVMGQSAAGLTQLFGAPDADVREGTSRKLQFQSSFCVLDTFLYPGKGGKEPTVTYLDARQPDGSPIDSASCVSALERRSGGK